MHRAALRELAALLAARKVSSVEMTRHFLGRVASAGAALNAFITIDEDKSLAQAKAADARIARGEAGPLTGIPIAHKDLFCAKGWLTTAGSKILGNFIPPYDSL
ncbi:MAG TPA: amidase family protein, partial [Usitatibacter sp.]|nr:amidase family protein [Usitatibacter sp.]